jgi:hypothetical protein
MHCPIITAKHATRRRAAPIAQPSSSLNYGMLALMSRCDSAKPMTMSGHVDGAEDVVAALRPGFRACFNAALVKNPDVAGSMCVTAKIGSRGEIVEATSSGGDTMGSEFLGCVVGRVRDATFAPPDGSAATIVIPVSFSLDRGKPTGGAWANEKTDDEAHAAISAIGAAGVGYLRFRRSNHLNAILNVGPLEPEHRVRDRHGWHPRNVGRVRA